MLRAFLAIDPPAGLHPLFAQVQEELKKSGADVRWVPVGNVHITLKFFGQIAETQVEPIVAAARDIARRKPPFVLKITGAGAFPSIKNPRVVWLGVEGDLNVLAELYRQLEAAFANLGFPPEDRPFSPHLTLGRMKSSRNRVELSRYLATLPPVESEPFQIREIVLYRSTLSPHGSTYSPLQIIPLAGKSLK
jgi:2'-5' RNA ligase|uniref:RNA 2',3'-cyclic phosphodiesterase n=1 Tax=Desulfobacca acetoxidans TaxID=60893 RepID=A0A7C3SJL9_9BACT